MMMPPLIDAAVRSLLLALAVWTGLRLFGVRNVVAQKAAWSAVLAFSLVMPVLLPLAAHLPGATVVLPIMAPQAAAAPSAPSDSDGAGLISTGRALSGRALSGQASAVQASNAPVLAAMDRVQAAEAPAVDERDGGVPLAKVHARPAPLWRSISLFEAASVLYFCVAGLLILRLLYGIGCAVRLWRTSEPVSLTVADLAGGLRVRFSASVSSPVTLGSGVVLPADYDQWDEEKLRIVLAHEGAHIRHGDFYLQALSGLYSALVWFSPLGWWLKRKLSDLSEAISDHSALNVAPSCSAYAQILLEFAAAPRTMMTGVAMARPSTLSRRIERLLNPNAFRQAFAGGRGTLLAALLVPGVLFTATALVRVEAATQGSQRNETVSSQTATSSQASVVGQSRPAPAQSVPASAPIAPVVSDAVQAPAPSGPETEPAAAAVPAAITMPVHVEVPPIHVDVPAVHVNVPEQHIDIPAVNVNVPAVHVNVPAQHVDVPAVHVDVPGQHIEVPAQHIDVPGVHVDVPAIHIDVPASGATDGFGGEASYGPARQLFALLDGFGHGLFQHGDSATTEATFDRTLAIHGKVELHIANGAGNIHLTAGSASRVKIHARVHSREGADEAEVRAIAANPPIEQDGNMIRIGAQRNQQGWHHISIDYEIEAPADAVLEAQSGSGDITDEGVGQGAKLTTGSGNIHATGLQGGFNTQTGSGDIAVENAGTGDAKAQTGSGRIEIQGVHGALKADTGSGNIKVAGTPTTDWRLQTGSGNVELSSGNAALTLDASTGSGNISTGSATVAQLSKGKHHFYGQLNGGGPAVRISTGSGNVNVD